MGNTCQSSNDSTQWEVPPYVEQVSSLSEFYMQPGISMVCGQMSPKRMQMPSSFSMMEEAQNIDDSPVICPMPESTTRSIFFPVPSQGCRDEPTRRPRRKRSRHVNFASSPTHDVHRTERFIQPYSEVYGVHPRDFDFDEFGEMVPRHRQTSLEGWNSGARHYNDEGRSSPAYHRALDGRWGTNHGSDESQCSRPAMMIGETNFAYGGWRDQL